MKKILIVCNTVYQLYNAINIRYNIHKDDDVKIILTDQTKGLFEIYTRLCKKKYFSSVYYIKNKNFNENIYSSRINNYKMNFTPHIMFKKYFKNIFKLEKIDIMYFSNYDPFTDILFRNLYKVNRSIDITEYEDGFSTYVDSKVSIGIQKKILSSIFKVPTIHTKECKLYLYDPELYVFPKTRKILNLPKINKNDNEYKDIVNDIFDYKESKYIDTKYIFFEESYFADGINIDDKKLILDICNQVGKTNISIKLHPRNNINRFKDDDINILNVNIPWEVFLLNNCFRDKAFVTIASNAALTSSIIYDEEVKVILLYKQINNFQPISENYEDYILKLCNKYRNNLKVLSRMEKITDNM